MEKKYNFIWKIVFFSLCCLLIARQASASYITLPASVGILDDDSSDCYLNSDGIYSGGSACEIRFYIPISSGNTLSSVTLYYYDNSGSQSIQGYLLRETLSSDSYSTLVSNYDSSTSASIQSMSLSYGSSLSSSYSYYVTVRLNYGTLLRGIRLYYY